MSLTTIVATGAAALAAVGLAIFYNRLVSARLRVREAWSLIEVHLQRRASLIPNLVDVVRAYGAWERDTLENVTRARGTLEAAGARPPAAARAHDELTGAVHALVALAEAYPDLKANEQFLQLQRDLTDTENRIASARHYYNGAVDLYNTRVQTFPGLVVAGWFGFVPAEFFTQSGLRSGAAV